jgi:hypothetical protein
VADQEPPFEVVAAGQASPDELRALTWSESLSEDQLNAWRRLASTWGATISVLLGLLGAGTVLNADDDVRALAGSTWPALFGCFALIALGSGAFAIYAAHVASQPVKVENIGPSTTEQVAAYEGLISRTQRWLNWSKIATCISIVALISSFAVRWYAPVG